MGKDKTSLLRSIILCFNPKFYPLVLRQSGWRSFLYLGLVCLIVYGFLGYRVATLRFDDAEKVAAAFYEKALPDFSFENGEANYPPDKPHVYQEETKDRVFAIIVDTSGNRKELDEKYHAGFLITKTEIVAKGLSGKIRKLAIPKTTEKVAAKEFFKNQMRTQRPRAIVADGFYLYLFHLVGKIILVAMVAGVFLLADKGKTQAYPFAYYFNVGCYAVTPFVLSAFARGGCNSPTLSYTIYGASLMLFLSLAISGLAKCRQQDARLAVKPNAEPQARL